MATESNLNDSLCPMCKSEFACANQSGVGCLYDTTKFCGGPIPGGEAGRISALRSLEMLDTAPESKFDAITGLMKQVFNTPASHMVLIDPTRCWFKSWQGSWCEFECDDGQGPYVQCPREEGWCNYILVPTTAELLVIEDSHKDARVSLNAFVVGPPYFRFYAGAPLVGSEGERYGTLCVVDFVPRSFSAEQYALLVNFAALAVEEIEHKKPLRDELGRSNINHVLNNRHLDFSIQAASDGILMVDMRESSWPIVYANPNFGVTCGLAFNDLVGGNFWDLFYPNNKTRTELSLPIGVGDTFETQVLCKSTWHEFNLRLLPAISDRMAPSKATGLPAWAPFEDSKTGASLSFRADGGSISDDMVDHVKCFWFVVICASTDNKSKWTAELSQASTTSASTTASFNSGPSSFGFSTSYGEYHLPADLGVQDLGPLLGTGSFGKVYRATTVDQLVVAVKVIDCRQRNDEVIEAQIREVQLSSRMDHPHVVKILTYATSTDMAGGKPIDILWCVQEFCSLGTLTSVAEKGWFRHERKLTSPADMNTLLPTLLDVSKAMAYVHSCSIIHADLTGRNVLLACSEDRPSGFIAKVSDFGLARYAYGHSFATKVLGTITHMPPELLRIDNQLLVPEADVWAFGIIAWEAYHGKCCYRGKAAPHIALAVVRNKPLEWSPEEPESFVSLMKRCLTYEHAERPAFTVVQEGLELLMA